MSGVGLGGLHVGDAGGTDVQDVGAERGEGARDCRTGEHLGVVDHADAVERQVAAGNRFGRGIANALEDHGGRIGQQLALRMSEPFLRRLDDDAGELRVNQLRLEICGVVGGDVFRDVVVGAAEDLERAIDDVREATQQIEIAAVAGWENTLPGGERVRAWTRAR